MATLHRVTVTDYKLPNGAILPKGTFVVIPSYAIHHDSELYPSPETFDPERFSEAGKRTRHPYAYVPFGDGPRSCVGMRFGLLQAKIGLVMLLRNFRFSAGPKTEYPLIFDQDSPLLVTLNGLWLNVEALNGPK